MDIRFYNTLSHQLEAFVPLSPPRVSMYNCGPTVYDYAHIGNFRAFIFADVLRRFLELRGYTVHQVMNLTDVGHMTEDQVADGAGIDKMQAAGERLKTAKKEGRAAVENPDDPYQVADYFIQAFLADGRALGLKIVDEFPHAMPRATQFVPQMQSMIARLIETGHAYVATDGAVYYSVQSFPEYGRLSGNTLDKLRGGAGGRVMQEHQAVKRHPADFLLWKADPSHLMKWDSPWGAGYPGWHIECSAMARALLKQDIIDLHTGGEDNIFPHHECEIAQSRGCTGEPHLARCWMHTRFLLVEGEKMSKSKGNFYTVRDLVARGVDPSVIRFELLKAHYRSNMNFTIKGLEDSASAVRKLRDAATTLQAASNDAPGDRAVPPPASARWDTHPMVRAFTESLNDDLNMSGALGVLFKWISGEHPDPGASLAALRQVDRVLNVLGHPQPAAPAEDDPAAALCRDLDAARQRKDFDTADRLRKELIAAGYDVMTTKAGTTAKKKLA